MHSQYVRHTGQSLFWQVDIDYLSDGVQEQLDDRYDTQGADQPPMILMSLSIEMYNNDAVLNKATPYRQSKARCLAGRSNS